MGNHKKRGMNLSKKKEDPTTGISKKNRSLEQINLNAAGIDIGSRHHYVAVPADRDTQCVQRFGSFTEELDRMADWLKSCGIETVAMESTGVYWIPVYELLTARGFEVLLVNARQIKNVNGRKSDVDDCEWIQQLHTYGLLQGAFIPDLVTSAVRSYVKQRERLLRESAKHVNQMQKALTQMNIQLNNVVRDITGKTGMQIIRLILSGERDPKKLAQCRDGRCKSSVEDIEKSLVGHYREEHLFSLKQSVELLDFIQEKLVECDGEIEKALSFFDKNNDPVTPLKPSKPVSKASKKNSPAFEVRERLFEVTGTDLTEIPGVNDLTALKVLAVVGPDMSRWKSEKHFASWLALCPNNKISGDKLLSSRTKRSSNMASNALRLAAQTLYKSKTALGAYYRRLRSRLGAPKAITATARKLACLIYRMLKYKMEYKEAGQEAYELKYKQRVVTNLKRKAKLMGFQLIPIEIN